MKWTNEATGRTIEIYNEDCMPALVKMQENEYELAIVDPPYGIGDFRTKQSKNHHKNIKWNNAIPNETYFNEINRVSKNRIIWGVNYYAKYINDVGRIVHDKTGGGKRRQANGLSDCDIASHSFGVNMKICHYVSIGNCIGNVIDWDNKLRWHPCQKPFSLYEWLLKNYAKENDRILDTHLGSGSIAIACWEMGFDLVGYELDTDYFEATCKRLDEHFRQGVLF